MMMLKFAEHNLKTFERISFLILGFYFLRKNIMLKKCDMLIINIRIVTINISHLTQQPPYF